MRPTCAEPGCLASIDHGDALYRANPIGEVPAIWKCRRHVGKPIEEPDIARVIEERNQGPNR